MSMNMFFASFNEAHIAQMLADNSQVEQLLYSEHMLQKTDVEQAWDIVRHIFDDAAGLFSIGEYIEDAPEMGFMVYTPQQVAEITTNFHINCLSEEEIKQQLAAIPDDDDAPYRLGSYQESPDEFVGECHHLMAFYKDAQHKNQGIVTWVG